MANKSGSRREQAGGDQEQDQKRATIWTNCIINPHRIQALTLGGQHE